MILPLVAGLFGLCLHLAAEHPHKMNNIFHTAADIKTPLALGGFVAAVLFFVLRQILQKGNQPVAIVSRIITFLFILCLTGMILGGVGYALPYLLPTGPVQAHEPLPCEGEWHVSIDYSRLHNESPTSYVGRGSAILTWKQSDQRYDVLIWVTVAAQGAGDTPLLTSVTRGDLDGDANGNPVAASMELDYRAQTGRAPYDKLPFGKLVYTDLQFEKSADGKRVDKITGKYHSSQTDAVVTFRR